MPRNTTHHDRDGADDIISERNLYRTYPVTIDEVEDAIDSDVLQVVHSASGGRFFRVAQVEAWVGTEDDAEEEEEADGEPRRGRRGAKAEAGEEE